MIKIRKPYEFRPISVEILNTYENKIHVDFPEEYRKFMLENNGGKTELHEINFINKDLYDFLPESRQSSSVRYFLALGDNLEYWMSLEKNYDTFKDRIPTSLFPIGVDDGGSQFCIGITGENKNKIFFWDNEFETEEPSFYNVTKLTNSFDEFLKM